MSFRSDVLEVREQFIADGKLIDPTEADLSLAWASYAGGRAGEAGIVDHVSFEVMRRLEIIDMFGNDKHFRTVGFHTLF